MIGIYKIENLVNGKVYIGQSINILARWSDHKYKLENNLHENSYLQNSWNKYGAENFKFQIVELCSKDNLNTKECEWIKKYDSFKNGYNLTGGGSGVRHFRPILQFSLMGEFLFKYEDVINASQQTGIAIEAIRNTAAKRCKNAGRYI